MKKSVKELPETLRPYEKCIRWGAEVLTDSELLAVILRCGTEGCNSLELGTSILELTETSAYPGLLGLLHLSVEDFMKIKGIGKVKAIQLKCIGELSKRMACAAARPALSFQNPQSIAKYYMELLRHEEQELLYAMFLDSRNHFLGDKLLSRGTVNATLITPREVFVEALKKHAVSLILIHNHPSGDPMPSPCDMEVTQRIQESGEMLGVHLLDHIIIGDQKFVSFREEKLLAAHSG